MRILRHAGALLRDLAGFAWSQKKWWVIPVVVLLLLAALVIVVAQTSAPFIYTMF